MGKGAKQGTTRAGFADTVGEVLNIGQGSQVTVNNAIRLFEVVVGAEARVRYVESQRGDVRHASADVRRAAATIG